jgi:hypothetical protein
MKIYPRSSWTAHVPLPFKEYHPTLPYFLEPPEVEFCLPNSNLLYLYINPYDSLTDLFNHIHNLGDINYNYALPANQLGAYTIRGQSNKCEGSENLRVLLLLGDKEDPSDVLKINQQDFLNFDTYLEAPGEIVMEDFGPTVGVGTFDLTEYLTWLDFYKGPNTGIYTDHLTDAVNEFQLLNDLPVTGRWDELTVKVASMDTFVPVDRKGKSRNNRPPVGNYVSGRAI